MLEALMDIDRPIQRAADTTYPSTPGEDRGPGRSHVCPQWSARSGLQARSAVLRLTSAAPGGAVGRHSRARSHRTHTCSPMRPQP